MSVLIVGGTSGIGLACAREFLKQDHHVCIAGRDAQRARDARSALGDPSRLTVALADASASHQMREAGERLRAPPGWFARARLLRSRAAPDAGGA